MRLSSRNRYKQLKKYYENDTYPSSLGIHF